jgi:hypothetical protein
MTGEWGGLSPGCHPPLMGGVRSGGVHPRGSGDHRVSAPRAARRQRAEAIRANVLAADGSPAAEAQDYAGWRAWALAEADALDLLLDGSAPFDRLPPIEDWTWRGW